MDDETEIIKVTRNNTVEIIIIIIIIMVMDEETDETMAHQEMAALMEMDLIQIEIIIIQDGKQRFGRSVFT